MRSPSAKVAVPLIASLAGSRRLRIRLASDMVGRRHPLPWPIGPGAVRSDLRQAGGVDARNRVATRANGAHIHHRGVNGHGIFDFDLVGHGGLRVTDQRHVGLGAAHVKGDHLLNPRRAPDTGGGHHARGRPSSRTSRNAAVVITPVRLSLRSSTAFGVLA
jgi:hypothetical protein